MKKVERVIQHCTQLGKNIRSRLRGAGDGLPIPPHKLLTLVAGGSDISWFLEIGRQGAESTIEILARNGVRTADFSTNGLLPPLGYADDAFDLVYSLSVFTHLPEGMQLDWIKELRRVISPGGYLLITTHGESYMSVMLPEEKDRFCAGQLVTRSETHAGTNTCAAFHPPAYVRRTLANGFEVIDFVPEGAKGNPHQDVFLLRKAGIA